MTTFTEIAAKHIIRVRLRDAGRNPENYWITFCCILDEGSVAVAVPKSVASTLEGVFDHELICMADMVVKVSNLRVLKNRFASETLCKSRADTAFLPTHVDLSALDACECGHDKHGLGFSTWCPAYKRHAESK